MHAPRASGYRWWETWLYARVAVPAMAGYHRTVVEALAKELPHGAACVDVGCGTGDMLMALAQRRRDCLLVGVDPSASAVLLGRRRTRLHRRIRWVRAGAEALPLPSRSCVGATATGVIKHCLDPARALVEMFRVVRPGGRLWLSEVDPDAATTSSRFAGLITGSPDVAARILSRFVLPHSVRRDRVRALALASGWLIDSEAALPDVPLYAFTLRRPS